MSHIDQALLDELRLVLEDEFGDLIKAFLDDSADRIVALRQQYDSKDWHQLSRTAHSFKGSAGNIGAQELSNLCMLLEEQAKDGLSSSEMIDKVDNEQAIVCTELKSLA